MAVPFRFHFPLSILILLGVTVPIIILKIHPYYHPLTYRATSCVILSSKQTSFRCCSYNNCDCMETCAETLQCDLNQLTKQPLNSFRCCHPTDCCAAYAYDTCTYMQCGADSSGNEVCNPQTEPCNYHCADGPYSVESCSGKCGTCMDSQIMIHSDVYNSSAIFSISCGLDDFRCQSQQAGYLVNSSVDCFYQPETGKLVLSTPPRDRLIALYCTILALAVVIWLAYLGFVIYRVCSCCA